MYYRLEPQRRYIGEAFTPPLGAGFLIGVKSGIG